MLMRTTEKPESADEGGEGYGHFVNHFFAFSFALFHIFSPRFALSILSRCRPPRKYQMYVRP
jgi:hypothetical protein